MKEWTRSSRLTHDSFISHTHTHARSNATLWPDVQIIEDTQQVQPTAGEPSLQGQQKRRRAACHCRVARMAAGLQGQGPVSLSLPAGPSPHPQMPRFLLLMGRSTLLSSAPGSSSPSSSQSSDRPDHKKEGVGDGGSLGTGSFSSSTSMESL